MNEHSVIMPDVFHTAMFSDTISIIRRLHKKHHCALPCKKEADVSEKKMIAAFVIWTILAFVFLGIGIRSAKMEKPAGFFSNVKAPEVKDVAGYNHAVSRLWIRYALLFEVIGIPFLFLKQNSPFLSEESKGYSVRLHCRTGQNRCVFAQMRM